MDKLEEAKNLVPASELIEATKLAGQLERACDAEQKIVARLNNLGSFWDVQIAEKERYITGLEAERNDLIKSRNTNPRFSKLAMRMTRITNLRADLTAKLKEIAYGLVDEKAFFPSGKKSQELTGRVTLKSQMPTAPVIADKYAFLEAAAQDGLLPLLCKKLTVTLVGPFAMMWWQKREDKNVGLEMPEPKILNIKVKEVK